MGSRERPAAWQQSSGIGRCSVRHTLMVQDAWGITEQLLSPPFTSPSSWYRLYVYES